MRRIWRQIFRAFLWVFALWIAGHFAWGFIRSFYMGYLRQNAEMELERNEDVPIERSSANRAALGPNDIAPESAARLEKSHADVAFLGRIATRRAIQSFTFQTKAGPSKQLPLSLHYTEAGKFVRAEYQSANPKNKIFPVEEIEYWHKQRGQKVVGLPSTPMGISLEDLFKKNMSAGELGDADRIEVTHELFENPNFKAKPVITFRIIGVEMPVSTGNVGKIYRVRYVFDEKGEMLFLDNAA
jgi:hypothetical protein